MSEPTRPRVPNAYRPRLKLFLSADIIGSTAYKQPLDIAHDDPKDHIKWSEIIEGFYKTIRESFEEHWQAAATMLVFRHGSEEQVRTLLGAAPRFWKTIGDEVVFWKELETGLQIWLALACWLKTVESVRAFFESYEDASANLLDVKSTAWLAGFPVRNKAVLEAASAHRPAKATIARLSAFYAGRRNAPVADFIGPGIDVGFRLASLSSARKMSISLDLAYILAKSQDSFRDCGLRAKDFFPLTTGAIDSEFTDRLSVHYGGSEELRGVLGGIHYPKFWLSTVKHGSLEQAKVDLYNPTDRSRVAWDKLAEYCDRFYDDRRKFVTRPFIEGDENPHLGTAPKEYWDFLRAAVPRESKALAKSSSDG